MSLRHIRAVTHKEIIYITRDRSSFILVILMPMLLLLLMSYALAVISGMCRSQSWIRTVAQYQEHLSRVSPQVMISICSPRYLQWKKSKTC